ncbi:hypothetical protein JTE90_027637 [Oedothorax gibbosus]|uniref:Uncharacterized protein n=1 Tax=Oedothorax gibbosus TaxID=931172 RepID=A0AAV6VJT8_9ARAC|nr:hypothetical protein JTE90_027637 [Oedothorax gibbosus]
MEIIGPKLKEGYGFTLTEIRELINELAGGNIIRNNEVKLRLLRYYENEISFSSSNSKNESLMVFSSKLDINEIIERMRKVDNIKTAAKEIREALQKVDFGLTNKFCDSDELITSWMTTEMPDEMLTILSTLLNINKGFLLPNSVNEEAYSDPDQSKMDTKDDDDEYDIENIATCHDKKMSVSAKVIFQILYYSIHRGLKQTPLHLMRQSPYESSIQTLLHNFINSKCVPREDDVRLLKVKEHGSEAYEQFRKDRFVNKTLKLSDVIRKIRLPTKERKIIIPTVKSQTAQATQKKSIAAADRSIHIAKARGETMKDILKYDLLPTSMLLDSSGYTSKPIRHVLLSEIEKKLDQEQYCFHLRR